MSRLAVTTLLISDVSKKSLHPVFMSNLNMTSMSEWVSSTIWKACHALFCTDFFFVGVTTPLPLPGHPKPCPPDKVWTSEEMYDISQVRDLSSFRGIWGVEHHNENLLGNQGNLETGPANHIRNLKSRWWKLVGLKKNRNWGREKWSCCQRDTYHVNLFVDFCIFFDFFGDFFPWFLGFESFASSHKHVRDILCKGLHLGTVIFPPSLSTCSYFFEATNQILHTQ